MVIDLQLLLWFVLKNMKVRRTSKFLSALAAGIPIVDKSWIVACKKAGKIVGKRFVRFLLLAV